MTEYVKKRYRQAIVSLIELLSVTVIVGTSFSIASNVLAQGFDFPDDWSECDCQYSLSENILGCANTADEVPRGVWLFPREWKVVVADKWISFDSTLIPIAYRIGKGETEVGVMHWNTKDNRAYSPDQIFHDRLLVAIIEDRRIAIKLFDGPVHIIHGCLDGREEAGKYIRALNRSE